MRKSLKARATLVNRAADFAGNEITRQLLTFLLAVLTVFCLPNLGNAQSVTIGSTAIPAILPATSTIQHGPIYTSPALAASYSRHAYLYTAAELGIPTGAIITNIEWLKADGATLNGNNGFTIYLGNTVQSSLSQYTTWGSLTALSSLVYASGSHRFVGPAGTFLGAPTNGLTTFSYSGGNLLVLTDFIRAGTASAPMNFVTNPAPDMELMTVGLSPLNNNSPLFNFYGSSRPTLRITFTPSNPCTAPPAAGIAVASDSIVCPGKAFALNLTGSSFGAGQTYQWQASPDGVSSWTAIGQAQNSQTLTTSQNTTTFYRALVSCSGQSSASNAIKVAIRTSIPASTFTIDQTAPATATNFISFTAALNYISCGINGPVVFNVAPGSGPYMEDVVVTSTPGASAVNTITFQGNGNILKGTANANGVPLRLIGADFYQFNNFTLENDIPTNTSHVVHLFDGADNNTFKGNTIRQVYPPNAFPFGYPVFIGSGSNNNNSFQNNTITGGFDGINITGSATETHAGNAFTGNIIKDFYRAGIYNNYAPGSFIEGNDISRPTRADGNNIIYGIWAATGSPSLTISKNRIHNTNDATTTNGGNTYGIFVESGGTPGNETLVKNNAIYNINHNGISLYALFNATADHTYYYHNTVSADDPNVSYIVLRGMYFANGSTNVRFMSNNLSLTSPGITKHAIYLGSSSLSLISNGNNLFVGATGSVGSYLGNLVTLADWKAANNGAYDQSSVSADPVYVNALLGNLKPTNPSLNNIGAALTPPVTDDITSTPRSLTTPDPGAYEFDPLLNDAGITAIVSPGQLVIPNSNTPVTVTLKNFGVAALTSATINWSVNGTAQTPFNWTGNLSNQQTTPVTVGSFNFPPGTHTLEVCSVTANGNTDFNTGNNCQTITLLSCAPLAGTYTINRNVPASATNFHSFTAAVSSLTNCGISGPVIINVDSTGGAFKEVIEISNIAGSSATNTIVFNGNGSKLASQNTIADAVLKLNGAKYIQFNNLALAAPANQYDKTTVKLINGAMYNTFNGCTITYSVNSCCGSQVVHLAPGSSYNSFQNNTISGAVSGIYNFGTIASRNLNNSFTGNIILDFQSYGIQGAFQTGTLMEANDLSRPNTFVSSSPVYGIYTGVQSIASTISKNRIHNIADSLFFQTITFYGIYNAASSTLGNENIIKNNAIYNVGVEGGTLCGLFNAGNHTYYFNNSISVDTTGATNSVLQGVFFNSFSTNVKFMNNNISLSSQGSLKYGIYLSTPDIQIQSNYNNFYVPNGYVGFNNAPQATIADWKTLNAANYDQNSVSVNPGFVNASTGNLRPTAPALDNKGTPLQQVTDDITGAPRNPNVPDVGAYEFTASQVGISKPTLLNSFQVYPNPSHGEFTVSVPAAKNYSLEITDLTGRVLKKEVIRDSNRAKLNLKGQAQGVYLLKITSEGASAVHKLIVE